LLSASEVRLGGRGGVQEENATNNDDDDDISNKASNRLGPARLLFTAMPYAL